MKKHTVYLVTLIALLFLFNGCKDKEKAKEDIVRPVKTIVVNGDENSLGKGYPAVTKAKKEIDITFRVGDAPIIEYNVVEGSLVKKGELIAAIDPGDFKIAVQSAKARYTQTKAESERYERLWKKGSVAKNDYDRKYANYQQALARLNEAQNNLAYTKIHAPFTGYYGAKQADIGDVIKANQPITKLYDLSGIEVVTTIPEQLAVRFQQFEKYEVLFETYPGHVFAANLKNMEKTPTPEGYKLHLNLNYQNNPDDPTSPKISAGMSCRVNITLKNTGKTDHLIIPIGAVFEGETDNTPSVWIVKKDHTVTKQHVVLDGFSGSEHVIIKSGLKPGQIIVAAGAKRLIEGQKVKILDQKNFN
jgi:RND family efflux transporter MFP subunit